MLIKIINQKLNLRIGEKYQKKVKILLIVIFVGGTVIIHVILKLVQAKESVVQWKMAFAKYVH